ncbi:unnamed protein product [Mytilus coruscus]|uniref:ALOG domain-containing protein n=1 Tax=Mytilus coruscus TaxID=42192 RepID=A0A6J8A5Q1_MYTCO|nr:unnamed protein product [Mytilus coruscus]
MDLLKIIKRYRSDKDPKLQEFDGKCLSTFSREDLLQVATNIKLHLNDILVLLDIDDSRENLCRVVSFALEQKEELREDTVIQEPPKKKAKTSENKSSGVSFRILFDIATVRFYAEREYCSGFYAEHEYCSCFYAERENGSGFHAEREYCSCFYAERGNCSSFYAEPEYCSGFYAEFEYCSGFYAEREYGSGFDAERVVVRAFMLNVNIVRVFMSNVNRETEKKYFDLLCLGMMLGSERKKDDEVMKTLEDKIADLEKKLEKKQADDELSEFERAKRDVKDEAAKGKDKFRLKPWEFDINLGTDPTSVTVRQPTFVNFENKIIDNDREVNSAEEVYSKATDGVSPDIRNVKFFNPKTFVAGQIHTRLHQWQKILPCSHSSDEILDWLVHGVNINKYIVHFKGDFWRHIYDDKFPPCRIFNNSNKCKKFSSFITETVMERLKNGSIGCIGKVAVLAAKLYTRETNNAISLGIRKQTSIPMTKDLKDEIINWRFLDSWTGKLEWKKERHLVVNIYTDASMYKWGGYLKINDREHKSHDSWAQEMLSLPIMVLEAKALLNVFRSIREDIKGSRVDANVDNQALIADEPSRKLSKSDATLDNETWYKIQEYFGGNTGHTIDLMALDSNSMTDRNGGILKHFTPCFSPLSAGVNLFAQTVDTNENCYVFPPFALLLPVLSFIRENMLNCTVILRVDGVIAAWVPTYYEFIQDAFVVGNKGQRGVLKYPTKKGYVQDGFGLPENLWAIRIKGKPSVCINYGKLLFLNEPLVSNKFHLICVGDSMIRFLEWQKDFNNPMNEFNQLLITTQEFEHLAQILQCTLESDRHVSVVLSAIIRCKDEAINARSTIINEKIEKLCKRNCWMFMDNSNINCRHLRDCVHLNEEEKGGKTQLHVTNCPLRTKHGLQVCKCPRTLASRSVDSLLGKIRALFRDEGRSGEWNPMLLTGNPAASHLLKKHLQVINQEQANASISVKQATPLMFSKLGKLCRHLSYRVSVEVDPISKFLYARDLAYFSILCHSGSRGGDLGLLTADRCFQIPDSDGIFVSQTAGKVASLDNPRNFIVLPSKDSDICPVKNFKKYITNAKELSITLTEGYVFRIQDKGSRKIVNEPVTSSCMTERLKLHLNVLKLYEGETSHSSRRGCAITLRMLGVNDEAINQHVGWGTKNMVDHYANVGKLISPKGPASVLSQAAENLD